MNNPEDRVTFIGRTTHRNSDVAFGINQRDRRSHVYVCGKTGTGKSHFLKSLILQDIHADQGCALFDPHGDLCRELIALVPARRRDDLIYLDAADPNLLWRFNPFQGVSPEGRPLAAAGIIEVFKKLWPDEWGPRLEHLLRNVVYTLLETPNTSFADVPKLLADREYRTAIVADITSDVVKEFWRDEYDEYSAAFRPVVVAPLQNKIGAMLTDPTTRRILTEPGVYIELRVMMDERRILVVNLDKGRIGEGPAALLGSLLISGIANAGLSRSALPESEREDFWVYADECQTFATLSLANMLSELRKYRVGLTLANQYLGQLETDIRDAVFGNAGTIISFRVGAMDAGYLSREFAPVFAEEDFMNLERYHMYLRLLIDGVQSRPFSATTRS